MPVVNAVSPFEGRLHWVGDVKEGVSQNTGNPYKMAKFTIVYTNHQMQESYITFSISGVEKVDRLLATPLSTLIRVTWVPNARAWTDANGKTTWFGTNDALGFAPVEANQPQPRYAPQGQPYQQPPMQPQAPVYQQPVQQAPAYYQGLSIPTQPPQYQAAPNVPAPTINDAPPTDDLPFSQSPGV